MTKRWKACYYSLKDLAESYLNPLKTQSNYEICTNPWPSFAINVNMFIFTMPAIKPERGNVRKVIYFQNNKLTS